LVMPIVQFRATTVPAGVLVRDIAALLRDHGCEQSSLWAGEVVAHVLGLKRLELLARPETRVLPHHQKAVRDMACRLVRGEPLQYVIGCCEFMGLRLKVDRRAFIPRPETEILVDTALEYLPDETRCTVADAGTGSGCIAVALARWRPKLSVLATDSSSAALALARENAALHSVVSRIAFRRADFLSGVQPGSLDAVISNPPYVPTAEYLELPRQIRSFEPREALDGGPDGLEPTRRLVQQAEYAVRSGGLLLVEIDCRRTAEVTKIMAKYGFRDFFVVKDLAGRDRVLGGRKS